MDHPYAIRPLEKTYSYGPETMGITDDSNVLGIEAPQWTEYIRDEEKLDMNTYARLLAIAEVAWTAPENKDYDDFESRLEHLREYFASIGAVLAPSWIYRGDTLGEVPEEERIEAGWKAWRDDSYFEVKLMNRTN